jgi:O-antigen ligase
MSEYPITQLTQDAFWPARRGTARWLAGGLRSPAASVSAAAALSSLLLGWALSGSHGLLIGAVGTGLVLLAGLACAFTRDPTGTLLGFWVLQVVLVPGSALVGYTSPLGESIRRGVDVITGALVVLVVVRVLSEQGPRVPLRYVIAGAGVGLCGLASSLAAHADPTVTIEGAWLGLKMWTLLAIALCLRWRRDDVTRMWTVFRRVGIGIALAGIADYFSHGGVAAALHTDVITKGVATYRSGAVSAIFATPGQYSLCMSLLFGIALAFYATMRQRRDLAAALLFAIAVALSLRLKGALSIGAAMVVVTACRSRRRRGGFVGLAALFVILGVGLFAFEGNVISRQVNTYTAAASDANARGLLYQAGKKIAVQHFPLGVGFGRFASYTSGSSYSAVYDEYGLSGVWGLSRPHPQFISDVSWPSVAGETGVLGLLFFLGGILALAYAAYRRFRAGALAQEAVTLALLCSIAVLLVDSLGAPSLFDWFAVTTVALVAGPALGRWATPYALEGPVRTRDRE